MVVAPSRRSVNIFAVAGVKNGLFWGFSLVNRRVFSAKVDWYVTPKQLFF